MVPWDVQTFAGWNILGGMSHSLRKQPTFRDATAGFREMTSEKRAQKFHTMTRHYPDLGSASDWLKQISHGTTNHKQYQDLGSAASSVWNFCARFSAVISGGNQW